jgi:DNA-binding transcriptional regulator of glucitol operon
MKTYFLILVIAIIAVQSFHAYWTINRYNKFNGRMKQLQNVLFCSILGFGILGYALLEQPIYAAVGAVIETLINLYYMDSGLKAHKQRLKRHWIAYLMAIVFPATIYFFSETYAGL